MESSERKVIAVVGATGSQGGGLARAILSQGPDCEFSVRALTRNTSSQKARHLAALGAEVVQADLDDEESLIRAFAGVYGAFCVTFFFYHFDPEREVFHAAALANACRIQGVQHVVWSTKEDTRLYMELDDPRIPTLAGNYKVPHFDAKGEADQVFATLQLPVTRVRTTFFWDSYLMRYRVFGMGPTKQGGRLVLTMPMGGKCLPGIASEDVGKCVLGIFRRRAEYVHKVVGLMGECLTGEAICEKMSAALGVTVAYNPVSPQEYRDLGFPAVDEISNMYQFIHDFHEVYCGHRDRWESSHLNPDLKTLDQWLVEHKDDIPLE